MLWLPNLDDEDDYYDPPNLIVGFTVYERVGVVYNRNDVINPVEICEVCENNEWIKDGF